MNREIAPSVSGNGRSHRELRTGFCPMLDGRRSAKRSSGAGWADHTKWRRTSEIYKNLVLLSRRATEIFPVEPPPPWPDRDLAPAAVDRQCPRERERSLRKNLHLDS
jgi:hypothetical protein